MMINRATIIRHTFFWGIFISYEIAFLYFTVGINATLTHFITYYGLNISLFYFNAYAILDYSFFNTKKPYLFAIGLIIFELIIYLLLKFGLDRLFNDSPTPHTDQLKHTQLYVMTNLWRAIYFVGLSIAYWSMVYLMRFKEKNHMIETAQLKTIAENLELENKYISVENAFLQNQISPHLLFNSLNFIHNQVYKESAEAGRSVSRLADLMRYSLIGADDKMVLLSQEVAQVENLIELCRMRFREQFYLRFKKKGKLSKVRIIPLILITFVENMMKHGDMGDKKHPANILVELEDVRLSFSARNKKRNTNLYPKTGLGLKNIEKRLSNYYQDRYQLTILGEEELFTVNLTIEL